MCVALIYTSKPCHSFSVACSILLMLILDFHWSRPVWGVIGQCHIWPLRKTLQCSLRDDECIPSGAEKEREPMVRQLTVTEPFVSAPCYHVKHFFSLKCIKYYFLVLFQLKLVLCVCFVKHWLCVLCKHVLKSAPVDLRKFLFQILGHMRPPLSGTVWRFQASL